MNIQHSDNTTGRYGSYKNNITNIYIDLVYTLLNIMVNKY